MGLGCGHATSLPKANDCCEVLLELWKYQQAQSDAVNGMHRPHSVLDVYAMPCDPLQRPNNFAAWITSIKSSIPCAETLVGRRSTH